MESFLVVSWTKKRTRFHPERNSLKIKYVFSACSDWNSVPPSSSTNKGLSEPDQVPACKKALRHEVLRADVLRLITTTNIQVTLLQSSELLQKLAAQQIQVHVTCTDFFSGRMITPLTELMIDKETLMVLFDASALVQESQNSQYQTNILPDRASFRQSSDDSYLGQNGRTDLYWVQTLRQTKVDLSILAAELGDDGSSRTLTVLSALEHWFSSEYVEDNQLLSLIQRMQQEDSIKPEMIQAVVDLLTSKLQRLAPWTELIESAASECSEISSDLFVMRLLEHSRKLNKFVTETHPAPKIIAFADDCPNRDAKLMIAGIFSRKPAIWAQIVAMNLRRFYDPSNRHSKLVQSVVSTEFKTQHQKLVRSVLSTITDQATNLDQLGSTGNFFLISSCPKLDPQPLEASNSSCGLTKVEYESKPQKHFGRMLLGNPECTVMQKSKVRCDEFFSRSSLSISTENRRIQIYLRHESKPHFPKHERSTNLSEVLGLRIRATEAGMITSTYRGGLYFLACVDYSATSMSGHLLHLGCCQVTDSHFSQVDLATVGLPTIADLVPRAEDLVQSKDEFSKPSIVIKKDQTIVLMRMQRTSSLLAYTFWRRKFVPLQTGQPYFPGFYMLPKPPRRVVDALMDLGFKLSEARNACLRLETESRLRVGRLQIYF